MNSAESQHEEHGKQVADHAPMARMLWRPSSPLELVTTVITWLTMLAFYGWLAGLLGFAGNDVQNISLWVMVGGFACSVIARLPGAIRAERERTRDIGALVESVSLQLDGLRVEVAKKTAALTQLDQEIGDRRIDLDAVAGELEERRKAVAVGVDQMADMYANLVQEIKGSEKRGNRSAWLFLVAGTLVSIPVGVLVNFLSG